MLSVALCTYNGENFLRDQLDSVARQTLLPDELVACDDCSDDDTLAILNKFRGSAPFPVHINRNEKNLGSSKNFEKAIRLCNGDIIALCDQDDVWKPHKLERLADVLKNNDGAGYVFSDAEVVDENLRHLGRSLWESIGFQGDLKNRFVKGAQFRCLIETHIVTGSTMAFRARTGRLAIPFPEEGNWIHDAWIAMVSSAVGYPGIALDETLVLYRQHSAQQLGAPESRQSPSLLGMYRELKTNRTNLVADWEKRCLEVLTLNARLQQLQRCCDSLALEQNLLFLKEFENHFHARRIILMSRNPSRYRLILREAFSGRYKQFSNSWRSIFRDMFL